MNRLQYLVHLIVFFLLTAVALQADTSAGRIEISGGLGLGVQILLDGDHRGNSSITQNELVFDNVSAGEHKLKATKQGLKPQEVSVLVKAGAVTRYRVQLTASSVTLESSSIQPAIPNASPFGSILIIRTIPVNCVISIPKLKVDRVQKVKPDWIVKNVSPGSYAATLDALGKTLQADISVRPSEPTVLMVNFLSGDIENQSTWANRQSMAAEATDIQANSAGAPKPVVEGAAEGAPTCEESLERAEVDYASIKQAIVGLDEQLADGRLGLEDTHRVIKQRMDWSQTLEAAKLARDNAADALKRDRRTRFQKDYSQFRDIVNASATLPSTVQTGAVSSAWRDLVRRWAVNGAGDTPTLLYWLNGHAHVASRPEAGSDTVVPNIDLELLWVTPGEFLLGSPKTELGRDNDEGPLTPVTFSAGFWLGKYEVTQFQWKVIMGKNPSNFANGGEMNPVDQVSWDDAMDFCRKLTVIEKQAGRLPKNYVYSLPTEAQWEYACRAGATEAFSGPPFDTFAWYITNSNKSTKPVGQLKPNSWGLHDMEGNVSEWCFDWKSTYPGVRVTDYCGPKSGTLHIYRGASWSDPASSCRIALRYGENPSFRSSQLGFRLCLSSDPKLALEDDYPATVSSKDR